jgi:hypothetical protein
MATQTHAKATRTPAGHAHKPDGRRSRAANSDTALDKAAHLSEEVLKSVEAGQRAAIDAVRKFVDTVDEMLPAGDRPSRRETVINGALEMADKLVATQYDFLRSVVRSAERALSEPGPAKK